MECDQCPYEAVMSYDWIESQANRLSSDECCLSEAQIEQEDANALRTVED